MQNRKVHARHACHSTCFATPLRSANFIAHALQQWSNRSYHVRSSLMPKLWCCPLPAPPVTAALSTPAASASTASLSGFTRTVPPPLPLPAPAPTIAAPALDPLLWPCREGGKEPAREVAGDAPRDMLRAM